MPTLGFAYDFEADGCRETYAQAEGWKEFKNIVEDAAQGQQTLSSFIKGNPVWVFKSECLTGLRTPRCWVDTNDRSFYYYFMGKEKEIEGRAYTMMGEVRMKDGELKVTKWLPVREEGGVVYTLTDSVPGVAHGAYKVGGDLYANIPYTRYGNECVLYDFNLQVGDQAANGYTVSSVDTCQLHDGSDCKVTVISNHFRLYDAIGYTNSLSGEIMDPWHNYPVFVSNNNIYGTRLNAYYRDGKMLYKAQELEDGWCVNDTCWDYNDAYNYATSYREDPNLEKVMQFINSSPEPDEELNDPTDAQDQQTQSIESAYIDMAMRTMSLMEQSEGEDENKVFSPLSLEMALGMLQSGASEETQQEILQALGCEEYGVEEVNAYNHYLIQELLADKTPSWINPTEERKPHVNIANAMFLDDSFHPLESYTSLCKENYGAEIETLNLQEPESYSRINEWCEKQAFGLCPTIEMHPSNLRKMVMVNALNFNAQWKVPFYENGMLSIDFYNEGIHPTTVKALYNNANRPYAETNTFQVVRMDYGYDSHFSMYIYLPKDKENTVLPTSEVWGQVHKSMEEYRVKLYLPPFNAYTNANMAEVCKSMGIHRMMDTDNAQFAQLVGDEPLYVEDIHQTTGIKTDFRGTFAYTATTVPTAVPTGGVAEKKAEVRVDHPFYFTIEDNTTHAILYLGYIGNITQAQQAYTPEALSLPLNSLMPATSLYDLQGRKVNNLSRKGLYIRDGKKVIKR